MRKSSSHRRRPLAGLRLAVECMPLATREAMLRGVSAGERIIAGAYVDGQGGVCPMLAAHRCGGRTDFLSFARSWDRFTGVRGSARAVTARELAILVSLLQESVEGADALDLGGAIADHRRLRGARIRRRRRFLEEADPKGEIAARRVRRAASEDLGDKLARGPADRAASPVSSRG